MVTDLLIPASSANITSYAVAYCLGGHLSATWCRTLSNFPTLEGARDLQDKMVRAGHPAYVYPTSVLDVIGLPEGPSPWWSYEHLRWMAHAPVEVTG
jgi:hypothetical protein